MSALDQIVRIIKGESSITIRLPRYLDYNIRIKTSNQFLFTFLPSLRDLI